jgi:hypothetical protein
MLRLQDFDCQAQELHDSQSKIMIFMSINGTLIQFSYLPVNTIHSLDHRWRESRDIYMKDLCLTNNSEREYEPGVSIDIKKSFILSFDGEEFHLQKFEEQKKSYFITDFILPLQEVENYQDMEEAEEEYLGAVEDFIHYVRLLSFVQRIPQHKRNTRMGEFKEIAKKFEFRSRKIYYSRESHISERKIALLSHWRHHVNKNVTNNPDKFWF